MHGQGLVNAREDARMTGPGTKWAVRAHEQTKVGRNAVQLIADTRIGVAVWIVLSPVGAHSVPPKTMRLHHAYECLRDE